jgi:hypothetical protein
MLSSQEEQHERRETLENDRKIREQTGTFLSHTHIDDAGGRFVAVNAATIVGQTPAPNYPAASPSWQIQLPDEPPLGFDNPALDETSTSPASVEATGGAESAPLSPSSVERPAPPSSSPDDGGFDDAA